MGGGAMFELSLDQESADIATQLKVKDHSYQIAQGHEVRQVVCLCLFCKKEAAGLC